MSWTSFLKRLVPETLRRRFDWLLHPLWGFPRGVLILLQTSPKRGLVQVFYGFNHLPKIGEPIHGGLVKFQRMQDEFPNTPREFNILYMVSSRMPYGGQQMAWFAKRKGAKFIWNQNGVAYPAWCPQGWKQINKPIAKIHASPRRSNRRMSRQKWQPSHPSGFQRKRSLSDAAVLSG